MTYDNGAPKTGVLKNDLITLWKWKGIEAVEIYGKSPLPQWNTVFQKKKYKTRITEKFLSVITFLSNKQTSCLSSGPHMSTYWNKHTLLFFVISDEFYVRHTASFSPYLLLLLLSLMGIVITYNCVEVRGEVLCSTMTEDMHIFFLFRVLCVRFICENAFVSYSNNEMWWIWLKYKMLQRTFYFYYFVITKEINYALHFWCHICYNIISSFINTIYIFIYLLYIYVIVTDA